MKKQLQKICGVYKIENTTNKITYIGSSKDIANRWSQHLYQLKGNYHGNAHLQNAWNKYGETSFAFNIMEESTEKAYRDVEQAYLDGADFKRLYNISTSAYGPSNQQLNKSLYILDLRGVVLQKVKSGVEACEFLNYGRQLNYKSINTSMVSKRKYRIVTPIFYDNNLDLIKSWPSHTDIGRQKELDKKLSVYTTTHGETVTKFLKLSDLVKTLGITTEAVSLQIRKSEDNLYRHKKSGTIIKKFYISKRNIEEWKNK